MSDTLSEPNLLIIFLGKMVTGGFPSQSDNKAESKIQKRDW